MQRSTEEIMAAVAARKLRNVPLGPGWLSEESLLLSRQLMYNNYTLFNGLMLTIGRLSPELQTVYHQRMNEWLSSEISKLEGGADGAVLALPGAGGEPVPGAV